MEEIEYHHHHHHHHHGHGSGDEDQGRQENATTVNGEVTSVITEQQTLSVPVVDTQTLGSVEAAVSFHSVSSVDSSAEMAKYFPNAQTPGLSSFRQQQEAEGQVQSTATSNTVVTTNINTVNAGPYIPVSAPIAVQQFTQPVRAPFMAQQQQRTIRPPGQPQRPTGIPSYSSQIEGLSVSQALVNDVLVDLQSKVINETLQQYQDDASSGTFLEPLPPIYIRAPQPTVILRSDLHRLRAELNSRVRPPVVYRHPAGANQYQQQHFQQNTFQAPRFPAPPQQYISPEYYGGYRNPVYATSDEYQTTTTTDDEQRKEREERSCNQAEPPIFNNDNINGNVQTAFDLQGLSTTPFDRYASLYQSSSFLPNLEDQQQGNEETTHSSAHHINDEEVARTDNMSSRPGRPRQEVTFDIDNCVYRCFEAHRQRVARRRAARQARRARRHKPSEPQQQPQQLYQTDPYQTLPTQPTYSSFGTIEQPPTSSSQYSDIISGLPGASTSVHTSQGPYGVDGTYDYTNVAQTSSLPTDIQQYSSSDIVNVHTSQIPFSSLSTSNIDATVPIDVESSGANYYQYRTIDTQEPYLSSNAFDYNSGQSAPSTTDYIQQSSIEQQQQQIPTQFIQNQGIYAQPSGTFDYPTESTQTQLPSYNYQNVEQQSYQYPYNGKDIQTEQKQTFDYANQGISSTDYYQQQPVAVPVPQTQAAYSQPTGTFEYTRESYQSQQPIYDYQGTEQQTSQYSYNAGDNQQVPQQDSFNYTTVTAATSYPPIQIDTNLTGQSQTFDASNYYQQQLPPTSASQAQEAYSQPTGTIEYTRESYQSQQPIYDYQGTEQQTSQYSYSVGDNQQVPQQDSFNYTNVTAATSYPPIQIDTNLTGQSQTFDASNYYQQQLPPASAAQTQGAYGQPTGTLEYSRESYQSQEPIYTYQGADQQSSQSQFSYNIEDIQQVQQPQLQDSYNYAGQAAATYSTSDIAVQQPAQNQTYDYSQQILSSGEYQQPISIPVSQAESSQLFGQRLTGGSIPTGTVEYTRQAYFSQEPLSDTYTTETFIQQQEENQSLNVNDYLNRFEPESSSQSTGGQIQSSDGLHSSTTITTTPFIIQQHGQIPSSQGAVQTYNLQNYTNESIVSETLQAPLSSSIYEEDHQRLLQQTEQYSDRDISLNETYSSLPPPPPPPVTQNIDYQQESFGTNISEFPPPPTSNLHAYQTTQQRADRLHTSTIPSTDQPNIYTGYQQSVSPSSDHPTEDDTREEEEIFDLQQCIANCYAKYQTSWTQEEQRKYEEQIRNIPQSSSDTNYQQFNQQTTANNLRPQFGTGEIHYIDGGTQTPSHHAVRQSDIVEHKYDETLPSFDSKSYIPHLSTRDLSADSRGQQTIEYSPPLITQTRLINPTIPTSVPLSSYTYTQHEQQQQQQQPIYDHTSPVPPHLSFNDTDYQPNLYFSSQITAQPRQYQNIPFDTDEQQQQQQNQQRYRAHSEPASIKQDSIVSIPSIQPSSSQIFEDQTRRSISIPMIYQQQQQPTQTRRPPVRLIDNGRAYETEATFYPRAPRIDPKTGLCLVPCPLSQKYAHLPPHLRPELFCIELPPPSTLPPVPPPPPPPPPPPRPVQQQQRWCVRCCCVPGQTLIKKVVYRQAEEEQQQQEESHYDYASVIDQMATKINVRYGNNLMEEGDAFVSGNYNEQLRVIDFPVYVSGQNDPNLTPLVPVN